MNIEERIVKLGIKIPPNSPPGALYVPVKQVGQVLYVSGQVPMINGVPVYTGKVGTERSIAYAQDAARLCITNMVAALKYYTGNLDDIKGCIKLMAFVSSEVGFDQQHIVVNAASQLLMDIFGEEGKHARSAVGTNQLPMNVTVEIEGIFELREQGSYEV
ncbi:RidA family protein [Paenibacillus endoradicis]|uniref:RidA family protein n=1 Tax=Paenibacillus endoradicis TaxID=2972487 RepID=UPI0021590E64|nr:RidA family protein [Paenibacillus endoradicis]MCR8656786.1 RidA family protein [Paenibacillus endoradicis]